MSAILRAVIYLRISKDLLDLGLGVARQRKMCVELAAREGLTVVEVITDNDVSAYSGKARPGFERMVQMLDDGSVDVVITYHVDRLYRRLSDLERLVAVLERTDVQVRTVASGPINFHDASGRMIARLLGAIAQAEGERMAERLRAKTDELAAAGKVPGGHAPFGYRRVRTSEGSNFEIIPEQATHVLAMAQRMLDGASLRTIARELNEAGVPTRHGVPWTYPSVRKVLTGAAIAGLRVHRGEIAGQGTWEAIIDRGTWDRVQDVLGDPARKVKRAPSTYPLSGLIFNVEGERMSGRTAYRSHGPHRTYQAKGVTHKTTIGADFIEGVVERAVLELTDRASLPVGGVQQPSSTGEVERLEAEKQELGRLRGEGVIDQAEWLAAKVPLQRRLDEAMAAADLVPRSGPAHLRTLATPGALRKLWHKPVDKGGLTQAQRRDVVEAIVERVEVRPASGRCFDEPERVRFVWRAAVSSMTSSR